MKSQVNYVYDFEDDPVDELKHWLFLENVRLNQQKQQLEDEYEALQKLKDEFEREKKRSAREQEFQEKKIVYNNNPIDKWCLINTEEKKDVNGNVQPVKSDERTRRIDGTAALLDAYVVYCNKRDEFESLI